MLGSRYQRGHGASMIGGSGAVLVEGNTKKREMKLSFRSHFFKRSPVENKETMETMNSPPSPVRSLFKVPSLITLKSSGGAASYDGDEEEKHCEDDSNSVSEFKTCLELLESGLYEDNRYGIERLMRLVNSELVNSKKVGSVAHALVCGGANNNNANSETERLRKVFLEYFWEQNQDCESISDDENEGDSSHEGSYYSEEHESLGRHNGALKLPALRVLASSLQLIAILDRTPENTLDLASTFWNQILPSFAQMVEIIHDHRVEATFSIKCISLLRKLEPKTIDPFVRYSMLPFLLHAHHFGTTTGDRILVRESEKILKPLGISP